MLRDWTEFNWTMVEVMKITVCSFKKVPRRHCCMQCPQNLQQPLPLQWGLCLCRRLMDTHVQVWVSLCGVTAPFPWVLVSTSFYLCPPRVYFPVLCKFWQLYGAVNGDLLQEGLSHTQSPAPRAAVHCWSVLLQETLRHSCLSLCGVSGSWWEQGFFEPSEHLCQVRGLTLNVILPLLPSCWGFSVASWMWGISSKSLKVYINMNDQFIKWPYLQIWEVDTETEMMKMKIKRLEFS